MGQLVHFEGLLVGWVLEHFLFLVRCQRDVVGLAEASFDFLPKSRPISLLRASSHVSLVAHFNDRLELRQHSFRLVLGNRLSHLVLSFFHAMLKFLVL